MFENGIISYETLTKLWIGQKAPSQQFLDTVANDVQLKLFRKLQSIGSVRLNPAVHTTTTDTYTLASSTPALPFTGNQLVVLGTALEPNRLRWVISMVTGSWIWPSATPNDYTGLWLGLGDGTFIRSLLALGQQPLALGAADLDGDGLPDLLIGNAGGLAVFQNAASWPALK